ncbi:MAG TPA: AsmA family protein [Verrucomicrobiae bacterium]|nr:AsmA family protein [Verrucomicrobiae bacterium]
MRKIFWSVVIILLVVVVAVAIVVSLMLGPVVKKAVETVGPQMTKTTVTLDDINLSLLTGSAMIKGFTIGNPQGYKATNAISVDEVSVGVNPLTVFSEKIVLRSIHVKSPEITFEGDPFSGNNLTQIDDNLKSASKNQKSTPSQTNQVVQSAKPAKKFEVDDFLLTGAKIHINYAGQEMAVDLPDVHLTNLGTESDGLTSAEVSKRVLDAIIAATIKAVSHEIQSKNLGNDLNKVKNLFKR